MTFLSPLLLNGIFIVLTFAGSLLFGLYAPPAFIDFAMFVPGAVGIFCMWANGEKIIPLFYGGAPRYIFLGLSMPLCVTGIAYGIASIGGLANYGLPPEALKAHQGDFLQYSAISF